MIITLTDSEGIAFDVDTNLIDGITGNNGKAELNMVSGESIKCQEDVLTVLNTIVQGFFGGNK